MMDIIIFLLLCTRLKNLLVPISIIPLAGGILSSGTGFFGASGTLNIRVLYKNIL